METPERPVISPRVASSRNAGLIQINGVARALQTFETLFQFEMYFCQCASPWILKIVSGLSTKADAH